MFGLGLRQKSDDALEKALSAGVISIEMDKMCRIRNDQLFGCRGIFHDGVNILWPAPEIPLRANNQYGNGG